MRQLGLEEKNLIKTHTVIRAAKVAKMVVFGFMPVSVQVVRLPYQKSIQALYITRQLKTLFLSRTHTHQKRQRHVLLSSRRTWSPVAAQQDRRHHLHQPRYPFLSPT